jgi:hypothetical protein
MTRSAQAENDSETAQSKRYPFGLSSRVFIVLVIASGLIVPGFLVYLLDSVGLRILSDIVWIVGYGSMVILVWYIWIRPLDLSGAAAQESSPSSEETDENQSDETTSHDSDNKDETDESDSSPDNMDEPYSGEQSDKDEDLDG